MKVSTANASANVERDAPGLVTDEIEVLARAVPLTGARVVELGCGNADLARKLVERGLVQSVIALEVDQALHARHVASVPVEGLAFMLGGADDIPLPDASCDVVLMLKSLHHVPVERMDRAFAEIARVLVPGGYAYISEPVYAGPLNDVVRLFHDEGAVRAAAYEAIQRAAEAGLMEPMAEITFETSAQYADFDDFDRRLVRTTPAGSTLSAAARRDVQRAFERFMTPTGARFVRPHRVNVLRKGVHRSSPASRAG